MDSARSRVDASPGSLLELEPDCERCCGLCCVAPAFAKSSDFAITKAAGDPCVHLTQRFRCEIHSHLRAGGFPGCVAYDCFGAGQRVTQEVFEGRTWRESPELASQMFDVFGVMRRLHSMLRHLTEAMNFELPPSLDSELKAKHAELARQSRLSADGLLGLDVVSQAKQVDGLLLRVSAAVRAAGA